MKIEIRKEKTIVELGDVIVLARNHGIRMIVKNNADETYGALNPETGHVHYRHNNITMLLKEYDIIRVVRHNSLKIVEE